MGNGGADFHLLVEQFGGNGSLGDREGLCAAHDAEGSHQQQDDEGLPLCKLEVGEGVSYLDLASGERPVLRCGHTPIGDAACALEPVWDGALPRLLMLSPCGLEALVNGQPAPRAVLLDVGDQVGIEGCSFVMHVTRYYKGQVGQAAEALMAKHCPICRSRFEAGKLVYSCWNCGTAMHFAEDGDGEEDMDCAQRSVECPVCHREVVLGGGYSYIPEV